MESVTRLSTLTAVVPAFATATFAGSVSAQSAIEDTIITEYDGLTATLESGGQSFDLDGDEIDDFAFGVFQPSNKFAALAVTSSDEFSLESELDILADEIGAIEAGGKGNSIFLNDDEGFAREFFAGDEVSGSSGRYYLQADLYRNFAGPLGEAMDTMFVGLSLDDDGPRLVRALDVSDEFTPIDDSPEITYGWAEFERGSLTLLRTGYNPTGGAAAIPGLAPVPVPASLLLLATGAAGLGALRRRQRKAA